MTEYALDALLAEYVAPPVPEGLAARIAAAALALPQEPRPAYARRAVAPLRHDRRGRWLRRPLLVGGVALGLAVSGAVAATLAGVRIDWPAIEALLDDLPFLRGEAPRDAAPPRVTPPAPSVPSAEPALAVEPTSAEERAADRVGEVTPEPPAPITRDEAPPVAAPGPVPARSDIVDPRLPDPRPALPSLGSTAELTRSEAPSTDTADREGTSSAPVAEPRTTAPAADELRLRQERIERAERLRAARQAQIERLQRVQQRRDRIRRLRRD